MRVVSISQSFNRKRLGVSTLGGAGVTVRTNRFITVVNPDKSKGDAFLAVAKKLRAPASNGILVGKGPFDRMGRGGQTGLEFRRVNFVLRTSGLIPFLAIRSRLRLTGGIRNDGISGRGHSRLLGRLNVFRLGGGFPDSLSNNREREITVTETLCRSPSIVLTSRPATDLSARGTFRIIRVLTQRAGLGGGTAVVIARSRHLVSCYSGMCMVGSNVLSREVNKWAGGKVRRRGVSDVGLCFLAFFIFFLISVI